MIAVAGPPTAPVILDRRRVEMIAGHDPDAPPFVYHAARRLPPADAERLVSEAAERSESRAREAIAAAVKAIGKYELVAAGVVVGAAPRASTLQTILASHSAIHAAEGALYRAAIARACAALGIRVVEVPARELGARAAGLFGIAVAAVPDHLTAIGRAHGRPWAKDQ
ncbi:MAG TPA: hypothetical protein VF945_03265 [Polyangia bacterium]